MGVFLCFVFFFVFSFFFFFVFVRAVWGGGGRAPAPPPENPYGVRIEKSVRIIGPSLTPIFHAGIVSEIETETGLTIPLWMSVDEVSSMIIGIDACGEPYITLASLLGNMYNSYYQFRIGVEGNKVVGLWKENQEVYI